MPTVESSGTASFPAGLTAELPRQSGNEVKVTGPIAGVSSLARRAFGGPFHHGKNAR